MTVSTIHKRSIGKMVTGQKSNYIDFKVVYKFTTLITNINVVNRVMNL